jgi:hypothetical protein
MAFLLAACLLPRAAHAGRSNYGWFYDTEVLPERGVELQTWILEENDKYGTNAQQTSLWWGAVIGITDQLELTLPIEFDWIADDTKTIFTFRRYGIEARYRFVSPDAAEAPPLVPLLRVAVKRDVGVRDEVRVEADGVLSYEVGAVQAVADLGFVGEISPNVSHTEFRPSLGVSVRTTSELRLGAELYSELSVDAQRESWAVIGPNLAWTHGRFWLSGTFGIGVYHVSTAPRVMWGIAF